ncbi:MAG: valine--tRNA ligase [Gammaproteobacteria bacterium]|nr:valine--tRNA ligase [Gammaproteobacteria bacterium]MCH9744819.1 valine--tRNA ligase [Gammaproteobacteria bacterium]
MRSKYQPDEIESYWSQKWEQSGYFQPQEGKPTNYSIILPPPNVTGTLHMGHGFQHTLMDALSRRARMQNSKTLWQPGTDHAGIATQMVVERQLSQQGTDRHTLGRDAFIEKVWQWQQQSGTTITQQMRRLGTSPDWSREKFSMSDEINHATHHAFIELYQQGLIYRGKRLVNWDPALNTAISDLEVENEQQAGSLWHIRYPIAGSNEHLIVATTRPETLLGDSAVAVHPEDERYQKLIGKNVQLPLTAREIPVIADEYVDREFGSGCVKITPAHDFNDYEMGKRHDLPMHNIMRLDAHLNDEVPEAYRGLERFEARKKIVSDLEKLDLIEKIEPYTVSVPKGDRSHAIIEPLLTDQWYIKMEPLAKPAIEAVHQGELQFAPKNWDKTYLQWLENIQDWCISRQLWWGHRIPIWYDDAGNHYVGFDEQDARQRNQLDDTLVLRQDEDVLDTWFTASLWPFSSLGWPNKKDPALKAFYPSNVMVTGFDIIFFWVARMVMMGLHFMGKVPFKEVYITGLIRDSHGQKMSKSKGNVLDPIDVIDGIDLESLITKRCNGLMQPQMINKVKQQTRKEFPEGIAAYGTDALRFTYCALATTGRDINFDISRAEGYRNFCNKLWNAARFVIMNTENKSRSNEAHDLNLTDKWIYSELSKTIQLVNQAFDNYRFDNAANAIYDFIWNKYCDWYLEFSKCQPNDSTRYTLLDVLETILRLIHPIMPFISEAIWHKVAPLLQRIDDSIMLQHYPESNDFKVDSDAIDKVNWLQNLIIAIRNIRGELGIAPSKRITIILNNATDQDIQRTKDCDLYIKALARVDNIQRHERSETTLTATATALLDGLEIHVPLEGLINKDDELARLKKEIEKLRKESEKSHNKLNNTSYVSKAPEAVVAKEREKLDNAQKSLEKLQQQYQVIERL